MKTCKGKSLSKEHQIEMVSKYSYMLPYLNSEDYDIQLAAIQSCYPTKKEHFKHIKNYITYPDLLELLELKMLVCDG